MAQESMLGVGDEIRANLATGMAGNHLSTSLSGLQEHRRTLEQAHVWAERANRVGWAEMGYDVAQLDAEMKAAGEDVDSSIKLSGDTHIHIAPQAEGQPPPTEPTPQPKPPKPPAPPPVKNGRIPAWVKWALAGAIGAAAGGPALTAWMLRPDGNPELGGASFDVKTRPPEWMQTNDTP